MPCGRHGRRLVPTARIRVACCARTARLPRSRRRAHRQSTEAIGFPRTYREMCSSPSPPPISSAASSCATTGRRFAQERVTTGGSSSRRPTSDSGRCICRVLRMAHSMSSTCIAASFNIAPTSRNICAIRSSRASSNSPSAWAVSIASCTRPRGGMPGRIFRVPRPRSWSRRFRIRTAGGATRRSSCSSNVVIERPWRRS